MRFLALVALTFAVSPFARAQGSGAPSPVGQTPTPQAVADAERAVQARHDRVVARSEVRAARRAEKAASANGG